MVTTRFTNILDIIGTYTFLGVRKTRVLRLFTSVKIWFERCHTCIDPQKRRIVVRYERCARLDFVTFTCKKLYPFGPDFTGFHTGCPH
ncbi:hypothetical protein EDO6_03151 [Paenibacillus xylanexedens]|nr:hypothetical protein EDO6_03151 [Paenibacillus xylanexedens]